MKKNTAKWVRTVLLAIWAAFLLCLIWILALTTKYAYGDWLANRYNLQERLYEAVSMYFASVQILVFAVALFMLSLWRLICTVMQPKMPGRITGWIRKKGLYPAIGLACLFVLLLLLDLAAVRRIANTVETNEAPAALHDYLLRGKLGIGTELAAIGSVVFLISWIRGRKTEKHERAEISAPSSGIE